MSDDQKNAAAVQEIKVAAPTPQQMWEMVMDARLNAETFEERLLDVNAQMLGAMKDRKILLRKVAELEERIKGLEDDVATARKALATSSKEAVPLTTPAKLADEPAPPEKIRPLRKGTDLQ